MIMNFEHTDFLNHLSITICSLKNMKSELLRVRLENVHLVPNISRKKTAHLVEILTIKSQLTLSIVNGPITQLYAPNALIHTPINSNFFPQYLRSEQELPA